jgi:hypothetical protein
MSYTSKQKEDVKDVIAKYTDQYLERYTQDTVIKKAEAAMDDNKTAIQVADAVYDYVYENNKDNILISTALPQCMPGDVLLIIRQEIINILK